MSATSEELASQAEQLQSAISYFRIDQNQASAAAVERPAPRTRSVQIREEIKVKAPHMARKPPTKANGGGFDLDLDDMGDDLDGEFSRRGAA
jgi:methyl-accepting chemotaxis protein